MPWSLSFSYPGVTSISTLDYLTQIGISPGTITIKCHPNSPPDARGTVTFGVTDGTTTRTRTPPLVVIDPPPGFAVDLPE